ncbi:MAG: YceI family protein [Prevotella sp.]|nr:YceI family protein [Prevotella sp.]
MKKKFVCAVCGYIHEGEEAPETCPVCSAPQSEFKEMASEVKKKFVCTVCGYIHEGDEAPEKCPVCGAPQSKFKEQNDERADGDHSIDLQSLVGKWEVDMTHARIGFEIKHCGLSFVSGMFSDFTIDINAKGQDLFDTEIVATIKTDSVNTGVAPRDGHLRTADFFETDKYPTMVFRSTKIIPQSKKEGKIEGMLTLRNVTKPVVLNAQLIDCMPSPMTQQTTAGFRLTGSINRADFEFGPKFVPAIIGNEVSLIIDAEFTPAN